MMRWTRVAVVLAFTACKAETLPPRDNPYGAGIATAPGIGEYLTTPDGMSLYVFFSDTQGTPTTDPDTVCFDDCLSAWPVFHLTGPLPSALSAADFGTFLRPDGTTQSTFRGWPLYTYAVDRAPGDIKGHEVGTWALATLDLTYPSDHEENPVDEPTDTDETDDDPTDDDPALALTVRTSGALGDYLADKNGMSLYVFLSDTRADGDTPAASACTGGCLVSWPIYHLDGPIDDRVDPADVGSFVRSGGVEQSTFAGWPLYTYAGDANPGDTTGHNIGTWRLARLSLAD